MVNKDTIITELLELNKDADGKILEILSDYGMHCLGCMMANGETIGEACAGHGIDTDELVEKINAVIKK